MLTRDLEGEGEVAEVIDLAEAVKKVIGDDVIIEKIDSNDDRSYHISSKKIKKFLNFFPRYTTKDAIIELKKAFINKNSCFLTTNLI